MITLKAGDSVPCPHCGKDQPDDKVEAFVVPGRVGPSSACNEECGWCDEWFVVTQTTEGVFTVEVLE